MELSEDLKKTEAAPATPAPATAVSGTADVIVPEAVKPAEMESEPVNVAVPGTAEPAEIKPSAPAVEPINAGTPAPEKTDVPGTADVIVSEVVKPAEMDSKTADVPAPEAVKPAEIDSERADVAADAELEKINVPAAEKADAINMEPKPADVIVPEAVKPAEAKTESAQTPPQANNSAEDIKAGLAFAEQLKAYRRTIIAKARIKKREHMEDNLKKIIAYTRENGKITNDGIERLTGVGDCRAGQYLKKLIKEKKLVRFGAGRAIHYKIAPGA